MTGWRIEGDIVYVKWHYELLYSLIERKQWLILLHDVEPVNLWL